MADRTLIWFHQHRLNEAIALRDQTPGAMLRNIRGWEGRVEESAARVIVESDATEIAAAYERDGAEVEYIGDPPTADEPAPGPEEGVAEPEGEGLPDGYHVEQSGSWYKLIGPDGEQVGNAKRSRDEAVAQVGD